MSTSLLRPARRRDSEPRFAADTAMTESTLLDPEARVGHLAVAGFGLGGTAGAIIGALAIGLAGSLTDVVLPGASLNMAGPLSALLLGAGAGAANGGLVGALVGWGIPIEVPQDAPTKGARTMRDSVRSVICPHCK
jgi:hypothetical protein